jgi:hypothetical protein
MNDRLLKEYVKSVLNEEFYWRGNEKESEEKKTKKRGFLDKLKSFFTGTGPADDLSSEWIEDMELYYDIDFPDETKEKIVKFARIKMPKIAARAKGDIEKAKSLTKKALSAKFSPEIRTIEKEIRKREEAEDEEDLKSI